jgi:hypothetical protein
VAGILYDKSPDWCIERQKSKVGLGGEERAFILKMITKGTGFMLHPAGTSPVFSL